MHYAKTLNYVYGIKWISNCTLHYMQKLIFMQQTLEVKANIMKFLEENIGRTDIFLRVRDRKRFLWGQTQDIVKIKNWIL